MVLDNASDPASSSPYDSAPPSDNDPYNNSNNSPSSIGNLPSGQMMIGNYRIDSSNFPNGFPIGGRIIGYTPEFTRQLTAMKITSAVKVMERPLRQEEVQSLAEHSAKQLALTSYGTATGIMLGLWRAMANARTYSFPGWSLNPEKFTARTIGRLATLKGRIVVHGLRALAYGGVGWAAGSIFFGTYAITVSAVGELRDPRLKDYVETLRDMAKKKRGELVTEANSNRSQQQGMQQKPAAGYGIDDASPTAGAYGDTVDESFPPSPEEIEEIKKSPERMNRLLLEQQARKRRALEWQRQQQGQQESNNTTQESEPFSLFSDDASPTNTPVSNNTNAGTLSNTNSGGSAWERLRQQATRPQPTTPSSSWPVESSQGQNQNSWQSRQMNAQQGKSGDDNSFTYSKRDEEKGYAKSQAQQEFDARVEAERGGGDFSGRGDGDQKRW